MNEVSIMPTCTLYSTERFSGSHRHEVFYGSGKRQKSIDLGLFVFLTPEMHNLSDKGVHFDKGFDLTLKQIGQITAMERFGWSKEKFIKEFGKNYLED